MVSVVMPAYNAEAYIAASIESVLAQTFPDFELIIVDDGSTDGTAAVIQSFTDPRIVYVRCETNQGQTQAINRGLDSAQGKYIARLDADDLANPDRLERQIAFLEANPPVGLLGGGYISINEHGQHIDTSFPIQDDMRIRWFMLFHNSFCNSTVVMRRSILDQHNLRYSDEFLHSEDFDLWGRLLEHTQGANLRTILCSYRIHSGSVSHHNHAKQIRDSVTLSKRRIEALDPCIHPTDEQILMLRAWHKEFPPRFQSPDELHTAHLLLDIAEAFYRKYATSEARKVRQRIMIRIMKALPFRATSLALIARMLRSEPMQVARFYAKGEFLRSGEGQTA